MTEKILDILKGSYTLTELDAGEFATLKANGMKFTVKAYHAEGLGHISVMRAAGFFGLMRMDTLMIVPTERDLPLYSYDRIFALGNDTLIVELYDTFVGKTDMSALNGVKAEFSHLPERDPGEHWYDGIKLSESISKKAKKKNLSDMDSLALSHFKAYIGAEDSGVTDPEEKRMLSARYVNGLLSNGGPSTDVFKKSLGAEKTERLFKEILFGTGY